MPDNFWFNRIVEYWVMPQGDELIEHIRRAKVQVVQIGNFGPLLYGLADDPEIERWAAGVPLYGLRENLDLAAIQIARCKEAGARVAPSARPRWIASTRSNASAATSKTGISSSTSSSTTSC